jgi:hypothetical protein
MEEMSESQLDQCNFGGISKAYQETRDLMKRMLEEASERLTNQEKAEIVIR